MAPTTLKIRLDSDALETWRQGAKLAGITLSEWIRRKCDDLPITMGGGHGDTTRRGVGKAEKAAVPSPLSESPSNTGKQPIRRTPDGLRLHKAEERDMGVVTEAPDLDSQIAAEWAKEQGVKIPRPKVGEPCQHGAGPGLCRFEKCHNHRSKVRRR